MNKSAVSVRRRPHATAQERTRLAQQYLQSGLSQREFALQHRVGLSTLQRWVARHSAKTSSSSSATAPTFTELKLPPLGGNEVRVRWAAEFVRSDGTTLRLAHDAPRALIQRLCRLC